jgi:hypothetical protein
VFGSKSVDGAFVASLETMIEMPLAGPITGRPSGRSLLVNAASREKANGGNQISWQQMTNRPRGHWVSHQSSSARSNRNCSMMSVKTKRV